MSRPIPATIVQGIEGWDADIENNFDLIFEGPIPLKVFATFAGLPAAGNFDNCLALVVEAGKKQQLFLSDGTNWIAVNPRHARKINLTKIAEAADVIQFTAQMKDLEGNDLALRTMLDIWTSDSGAFGTPEAGGMVGNISVGTGTRLTIHSTPFIQAITDATGKVIFDIEVSDARTKAVMVSSPFLMVSLDGIWTV